MTSQNFFGSSFGRLAVSLFGIMGRIRKVVVEYTERQRTIRELSQLDDQALKDIGISRSMIRASASGITRLPSGANENKGQYAA